MSATAQTPDAPPALPAWLRVTLTGTAIAFLAISGWIVWKAPILAPFSDMLDWVARYLDFRANHDVGAYLLAPHVSHHLVLTFLILWADASLFEAHGWLFVIVGLSLLVLTAALLGVAAGGSVESDLRWVMGGAAAGLVLLPPGIHDATLQIYTVYIEALVLSVAAILLASPSGDTPPSPVRLGLALACAAAAAFGNGVALAVWPVLALSAWRRNRMLGQILLAAGVLFGLAYFGGQGGGATAGVPLSGGGVLAALLTFLNYMGLPWTRAVSSLGWLIGLALTALSGWAILRRGGVEAARAERVAVQLIQFSLITAVMAAIGRSGAEAPRDIPLRYAVLLTPLHVGLLMLAAPGLQLRWVRRPRTAQALLATAAILMVAHQAGAGAFVVRTSDIIRARVAAFQVGDRSAPVLATVYPDADKAAALLSRMRAQGLYQPD